MYNRSIISYKFADKIKVNRKKRSKREGSLWDSVKTGAGYGAGIGSVGGTVLGGLAGNHAYNTVKREPDLEVPPGGRAGLVSGSALGGGLYGASSGALLGSGIGAATHGVKALLRKYRKWRSGKKR